MKEKLTLELRLNGNRRVTVNDEGHMHGPTLFHGGYHFESRRIGRGSCYRIIPKHLHNNCSRYYRIQQCSKNRSWKPPCSGDVGCIRISATGTKNVAVIKFIHDIYPAIIECGGEQLDIFIESDSLLPYLYVKFLPNNKSCMQQLHVKASVVNLTIEAFSDVRLQLQDLKVYDDIVLIDHPPHSTFTLESSPELGDNGLLMFRHIKED